MNYRSKHKSGIDFYILFPFLLVLFLWIIFFLDTHFRLHLIDYGVKARSFNGLPGIVLHFFIHGNFNHILSNTLSFLVLSLLLFHSYRSIAFYVFFSSWISTGTFLWLFGRAVEHGNSVVHIGASGVIFGLFGFLLVSGLIRNNKRLMAITALVIFLYGYMIWGIFPLERQISWDGHLCGWMSGIFLAILFRKKGSKPDEFPLLSEELEDELDRLPEDEKYWLKDENYEEEKANFTASANPLSPPPVQLFYHYKKNNSDNGTEGETN